MNNLTSSPAVAIVDNSLLSRLIDRVELLTDLINNQKFNEPISRDLITVDEALKRFSISRSMFERLKNEQCFEVYKISGKKIMVSIKDMERYFKSKKV